MKEKKLSWNDITYRQFQALKDAFEIEDETDKMIAIAQAVYGEDVIDKPITEFNELCSQLSFLNNEIPNDITVKEVNVNGRTYYFDGLLGRITTAQYIDFQNYLKAEDNIKCYSVFMIPKGHKYNDGYDMMQVFDDIQDMPVSVLTSASFFFNRQFELFIKIFQHYSMKKLKKQLKGTTLPKEMKNTILRIAENSNSLVSYLMYSNSVK